MSQRLAFSKPATALFCILIMVSGTVLASTNIENSNEPYKSGTDDQYSDDTYQHLAPESYGHDTLRGTGPITTSAPNPQGEVYETYFFGRNTIPTAEGMVEVNNNWEISGNTFRTTPGAEGIQAVIAGGQTGGATMNLEWAHYDYVEGGTDYNGSAASITFDGMYDLPVVAPTIGAAATAIDQFVVGNTVDCSGMAVPLVDVDNNCMFDGWEITLPLCEGLNCTSAIAGGSSQHEHQLYVGNGVYGLHRANWALTTTAVDEYFVFSYSDVLGFNNAANQIEIHVQTQKNGAWTILEDGDVINSENKIRYQINHVSSITTPSTPISGFTPTVSGCDDTQDAFIHDANGDGVIDEEATGKTGFTCGALPADTHIWNKGGALVISVGVDYERINNPNYFNEWNNVSTLTHIQFDPSTTFKGITAFQESDNMNDQKFDGEWKFGVDRDGCEIYHYPCTFGTVGSQATAGYTTLDDYGDYTMGDGWCGDNSVDWDEGNAGCRFSPLTASIAGIQTQNHWDAQAWNTAKASMPLIDATNDFDGAVIQMDIDKNHWTSQSGGWFDMSLEIALQAPGYTDGTWLPGQPGVTGDGGWFETCYNGYIDVYIVPEGSWNAWYREAQYGYVYGGANFPQSTGGSGIETGLSTSDTWLVGYDGDATSEDEYWYRNDGRVKSSQGWLSTDGKRSTWVYPHDETSYSVNPSNGQTIRATNAGGGYWGLLPEFGYTTSSGQDTFIRNDNAQMKINQWHPFLNEDGEWIYDDDVEGGTGTLWNKPGASGDSEAPHGVGSSFDQIMDFWDINIYDDATYSSQPTDANAGSSSANGLERYHVSTTRLGTATKDFCYDPISWNAQQRADTTGRTIEGNTHIVHDVLAGESFLNLDIPAASLFGQSAARTSNTLHQQGWLDSPTDSTIGFTMLIDVRGINGKQSEVCWGDWATGTNEVDDISDKDWDFCLDQGGLPNAATIGARNNIPFGDFSADTPCVSDAPATGQNAGQNPDEAFWCGLNLDTPFSDYENIRIKAQSAPFVPPADSDKDGIDDQFDLCPNTPTGTTVSSNGCSILDSDNNGIDCDEPDDQKAPGCPTSGGNQGGNQGGIGGYDPAQSDDDSDGIPDSRDRCDRIGGTVDKPGAAVDYSYYTQLMHQEFLSNPVNVDVDGCPIQSTTPPPPEPCLNDATPDIGAYPYEDNDGDGLKDEDWIDGLDNDGDGLIDEDPLDDCPNDNVDRKHDALFNGRASMFQETRINGTWNSHTGSMVVAENNTGIASGNEQFVFNSNSVNWQSTYSSSSLLSATESANEVLVLDDGYLTERFTCQAIGTGTQKTYMRMFSYVWVPLSDNDIANPSSVIGGIVESPYGDDVDGKWVAYGKAGFGGASTSTTLLSGWAEGIDAGQVASGTNAGNNGKGILDNEVKKEVIMGEGYYKISCVASQEQTTSAGQATFAQFEISQNVWAVELCADGTSPLRNEATDVDYPFTCASSGGGGDVGSAANDFWDALTDSFFALGVLVAFVAGAAALWFIDRKNAAVGLALIGIGVASAFFVREVDLETSTQEVWGTIAHLLIAGGIFWSFFPYQDMPGKTAAVSLFIGVWGLIHALDNMLEDGVSLGGLEDYLIPAIPGAAVLLAAVGLTLGIYATAVQFQVVDDFTGLIEED